MKVLTYLKSKKFSVIILLVIGFLLFSRFFKILEVPTAFVHDELIYVMQARAISLTGRDMSGTWHPLSLQPFDTAFAELPSVIMSLGSNLTNNPVLNGKIMHLLTGILIPFALSWLVLGIWKNKNTSIITLILASFNPWLWQFSRMTFDSLFSVFFYILGGAIILNCSKWWKLLSIPVLFLGFYQYQGLKLIFIPMIFCFIGIALIEKKVINFKKLTFPKMDSELISLSIILLFSAVVFSYYVFVSLPQQSAVSRLSQIILFEKEFITAEVTVNRQLSLYTPFLPLVANKYSVVGGTIIKNTFKALNPSFIFFAPNEAANRFVTINHGYLYILDFILIGIGLVYLANKSQLLGKNIFYGSLLLISLIPAVITVGQSFTFRASLFYILLIPLSAFAITSLLENKKTKLLLFTCFVYLVSVIHFGYHYFYQYPVYAADGQFFVERILANYIKRVPKDRQILVYSTDQEYIFNSYLFYNNLYTKQSAPQIQQSITSNTFTFENVEIRKGCISPTQLDPDAILITVGSPEICQVDGQSMPATTLTTQLSYPLSIPAISDSGELYKVFGDVVCSKYELNTYIVPRESRLFAVENLSDQEFCSTWLTNLNPR